MKTKDAQINEDMAALKEDLRRLGADLAELPSRIRSYRRNTTMRSREKLRDAVTGLENRAKDRVQNASERLKSRGHHAVGKWRGGIEHRPFASMATAFAAGWLLATVVGRAHKHH